MPTFKDIARLSGVSYGTVSNVLNGRGNVSSDKVMRVLQAADQLGYVRNQGAQQLRKGSAKLLAVIRPTVKDREYASFYAGFTSYALSQGYKTFNTCTAAPSRPRRTRPARRAPPWRRARR